MISDEDKKTYIGRIVLKRMPDSIRRAIIEDVDFLEQIGLQQDINAEVSFGNGMLFNLKQILSSIREADASGGDSILNDIEGNVWNLQFESDSEGVILAKFTYGDSTCVFLDAGLLLGDKNIRLQTFERAANACGLPQKDQKYWKSILSSRPLSDWQFVELHNDLEDTPIKFSEKLCASIPSGKCQLELLVPSKRRYYERLIGDLGEAKNVVEHADGGARQRIEELINWNAEKGLLLSLPIASQSQISLSFPVQRIPIEIILRVFKFLLKSGDEISQLSAIEIGLPFVSEYPDLMDSIASLVESLTSENPEDPLSGFYILSHLFMLIDADLSAKRIFQNFPPFYRRQAALAHASIVHRQLIISKIDTSIICKWALEQFLLQFYVQSLVDMRTEPFWYPDLIDPVQLKQEFIGRLLTAGVKYKEHLGDGRLSDFLSSESTHEKSVKNIVEFPKPFYPGPLEGAPPSLTEIPVDLRQIIEEQLAKPVLGTSSFVTVINLANVYELEGDLSARIAEVIKNKKYQILKVADTDEMSAVLSGLARVAAVSRSTELAQEIRVLVRKYRRDSEFKISLMYTVRILLFASAAHSDFHDWLNFIGKALEELSLSPLTKDEAREFSAFIHALCVAEPELWTVIGAADAALSAFLSS